MKLGIALPHTWSHYPKQFVHSFFCMIRPDDAVLLTPECDGPLDSVRNELVTQAQMHDCTQIFWADTDQMYPPDTMVRMINHHLPVVVAKVHRRKEPYDPLLKRINPDKDDKNNPYIDIDFEEWAFRVEPLIEVDATGLGCALIDIEVFDRISPPWFMYEIYKKPPIGEDFYFWRKVKDAGYRIMVDLTIDIRHLTVGAVNKDTFLAYRKSQLQAMG